MSRDEKSYLVVQLLALVFGISLIVFQQSAFARLMQIAAAVLLLLGIAGLVRYWLDVRAGEAAPLPLSPIVLTLGGVLVLILQWAAVWLLPLLLGVWLLALFLCDLVEALRRRRGRERAWWAILVSALPYLLGGCFCLFAPDSVSGLFALVLGVCLALSACLNLIRLLIAHIRR